MSVPFPTILVPEAIKRNVICFFDVGRTSVTYCIYLSWMLKLIEFGLFPNFDRISANKLSIYNFSTYLYKYFLYLYNTYFLLMCKNT